MSLVSRILSTLHYTFIDTKKDHCLSFHYDDNTKKRIVVGVLYQFSFLNYVPRLILPSRLSPTTPVDLLSLLTCRLSSTMEIPTFLFPFCVTMFSGSRRWRTVLDPGHYPRRVVLYPGAHRTPGQFTVDLG